MKVVKILLKIVVCVIALVLVALLTLPLWLGPVGKLVANSVAPGIVKTDFHLGHLSLNPYTARFELGDMQLSNPTGYSEKYAVTVGELAFDAKTASLVTDVIHIEEIKIKDIFVSYVSGGPEKVNNFQQIQYNVAGGKEKYEAAKLKKEQLKAERIEKEDGSKQAKEQPKSEAEKPAKKVVIDRLEVSGIVVQLGFMPIRVPSLTLTDIGKESNGATVEEIWQKIVESVLKAAGVVGDQLKALGGSIGDMSGSAAKAVSGATSKATAAVTGAASKTTDAVTGAASATTKAVGDTATKAVEGVGNALKKLW